MNKTAYIVITSKCNYACDYCFYQQEPERHIEDRFDKKTLTKLIASLKKHNFNEITITGGEPLLKKEIVYCILEQAKKNKITTNLNTNGSLLDNEIIKKLSDLGLTNLFLSSNFLEKSSKFLDSIEKYFRVYLIHVITKSNLGKLKEVIKNAETNSLNLILQPAYIIERNLILFEKLSLKMLSSFEFNELKKNLDAWAETTDKQKYVDLIISYYLEKDELPKFCHLVKNDIIIEASGDVLPCFHKRDMVAGNILNDNFEYILERHDSFKSELVNAKCFGEHCISLFY